MRLIALSEQAAWFDPTGGAGKRAASCDANTLLERLLSAGTWPGMRRFLDCLGSSGLDLARLFPKASMGASLGKPTPAALRGAVEFREGTCETDIRGFCEGEAVVGISSVEEAAHFARKFLALGAVANGASTEGIPLRSYDIGKDQRLPPQCAHDGGALCIRRDAHADCPGLDADGMCTWGGVALKKVARALYVPASFVRFDESREASVNYFFYDVCNRINWGGINRPGDADGEQELYGWALSYAEDAGQDAESAIRLLCGDLVQRYDNLFLMGITISLRSYSILTRSAQPALCYDPADGMRMVDQQCPPMGAMEAIYECMRSAIAEKRVSLCPVCGEPVVRRKPGSKKLYCSASCKTKASSRKRERAMLMHAQGVPLDEARRELNTDSVAQWYSEAEALGR